jgi:hypothetical protein
MTGKYRYDNQEILKYVGAVVLAVAIILNESGLGQIQSLILALAAGKFLLDLVGRCKEKEPCSGQSLLPQ